MGNGNANASEVLLQDGFNLKSKIAYPTYKRHCFSQNRFFCLVFMVLLTITKISITGRESSSKNENSVHIFLLSLLLLYYSRLSFFCELKHKKQGCIFGLKMWGLMCEAFNLAYSPEIYLFI